MHNFGTIYRYEVKKLIGRKLLWITAFLCVIGIVLTSFAGLLGTYYVDGKAIESNYIGYRKDQEYRKNLSGRYIDETLLRETVEGYSHVPTNVLRYTLTEEYEHYARPYSAIFLFISTWTEMGLSEIQNWEVDEAALYEGRSRRLENKWNSILLTETEKEFWRDKESQIDKPLLYSYHDGYEMILNSFLTVGVLMLLFVAICLPNLFADEHVRRTDQLVLSSVRGKETTYWAKIFAGVTVSVVAAILMALITIGLNLGYYGADGFDMPLQTCFSSYSYPITVGEACLIAYGVFVITSILAAVFVMILSELFHSGMIALAISAGMIILGNMIMIPSQYRVISQIWDWSPVAYLSVWNAFDARTLTLFGHCFVSWQVVPLIYILLSIILAIGGKYIYRRYQVCGY